MKALASSLLLSALAFAFYVYADTSMLNIEPDPEPAAAPISEPELAPEPAPAKKLKIAIVPGHDDKAWGAEYLGVREADMNVALGEALAKFLRTDPDMEVTLLRDSWGYEAGFEKYFEENRANIVAFQAERKAWMKGAVKGGEVEPYDGVIHNTAKKSVAERLYGVNKWANDSGIDIVLHIHFNDYPERKWYEQGEHQGYAIYIPEKQYRNSEKSKEVAGHLFQAIERFYAHSDLPKEDTGIVEDQGLIAVGSNDSLNAAGILVEYGYIYESVFIDPQTRDRVIEDMAYQTYLGLEAYAGRDLALRPYPTTLLPYKFEKPFSASLSSRQDALALQRALAISGFFPPAGYTEYQCPQTGFFRKCTTLALAAFQKANGIAPSDGKAGKATLTLLNSLFAPKP